MNFHGRPGSLSGLFFDQSLVARSTSKDKTLTENSKSRDQAESAFGKTQTQFLARNRTISEIDAVAIARDAKTARLRELRLEKEAAEAPAGETGKKAGKR
jgi:hypothetical protein